MELPQGRDGEVFSQEEHYDDGSEARQKQQQDDHQQHQHQPRREAVTTTFEQMFEQFYLQLADGKTGGMVVSEGISLKS